MRASDRLILFNSAYYAKYFVNVLNTLSYPSETLNEYRYPCRMVARAALPNAVPDGAEVTIVYIDRWADGGYRFIPLRHGDLQACDHDGSMVHFRVRLLDYVEQPEDDAAFQAAFAACISALDGPRLVDGDPLNDQDGNYALIAQAPPALVRSAAREDLGWDRTVLAVQQTKAYASHLIGYPVFTRLAIVADDDQTIAVRSRGPALVASADLVRGHRHSVEVSFRHPAYASIRGRSPVLEFETTENIRILGARSLALDAPANREFISFAFNKFSEDSEGALWLRGSMCDEDQDDRRLLVASLPVIFRAVDEPGLVPKVVAIAATFAIGLALLGLSRELAKVSLHQGLAWGDWWPTTALTFLGVLLQGVAALWAVRVVGRKFL
ncbi:MAG: hypothetical protein AAFR38_12455 [Planctomycetota bacterium]